MNPWWFVLVPLAVAWGIPVMAMRRSGIPAWAVICMGCFWLLVCLAAEPLYDWGVLIRKRLGLVRLAAFAEKEKPRLILPARLALFIMALISVIGAWL